MLRLAVPLLFAMTPLLSCAEEVIRVYNWNDYIAPQVLTDFTAQTGIKVDYQTFSTAEELEAALNNGEPYDVAVAQHNSLPMLIEKKLIQPLDQTLLPNRTHIDKQLLSNLIALDPNNQHAMPYQWGAMGLAINVPKAEAAYGGPLPESWSVLFDPEQNARLAGCGVSVLDAPDEVLTVLLNYQGYNLARSGRSRIERSARLLEAIRPNVRYVDSERYIDDLNEGNLCVAVSWVGDALVAAQSGQPVRFVIPQEGSVLFIDNMVIPAQSARPDLAHTFINYLMDPKVAAKTTAETLYPSGNAHVREHLDESLRNLPDLYPSRETKRRLYTLETLPQKHQSVRDQVWSQFRTDI
ncbi:extracellular solute-binding protein [Pseudomonas sp. TTU2014-080ASC]|uniref:extracellular solute-binding protein n=1 Tax=Pseudomonas sp. TTU2014-080ASC TaxID=1729724 RepID=UPI0007187C80|nr:extracellular solute-binding protein [Pseudomonas sp. TTU2014-080ASC]KRW59036.1 spermidine/putrescine ABC transporter substrate-binding protein [Pseudomonas sp. TTU2014-080ASC]